MQRLSGLDASFLYFETPANHLQVSAIMVFDPSTVPGGYSFERVKATVASRLHLVPPFRRRLIPVPFNLHHPIWIEDPDFDLDFHLRRIAAPAPGGPRELADIAGDIAGRQLDRTKPLWEIWVVEGLQNGHIATVSKMHHCTIDGVSGANILVHLLDLAPDPAESPSPPPEWKPEHKPSDLELVGHALNSRLRQPARLAKVVPNTVGALARIVLRRREGAPKGGTPLTAPRTSFNLAVTAHRRVAFTTVPLEEVKAIKKAFGTTVNDAVLAICAGALRRYLDQVGDEVDKPLIVTAPISVRTDGDDTDTGANKVSAMFTSLPTHIDDPVERLYAIHESTKGAKEEHNALGATMLQEWAELAAPNVFSQAARLYSRLKLTERHPVIHNLVISNVPGPPFPLYFAGAKLTALYPLGPIFDGAGLNITVLSYTDSMGFGFIACRELMPRLWDLATAVGGATAELAKRAAQETTPPRRARSKSPPPSQPGSRSRPHK
jgi:WS/DGAT/MGAT family acyltransferase